MDVIVKTNNIVSNHGVLLYSTAHLYGQHVVNPTAKELLCCCQYVLF